MRWKGRRGSGNIEDRRGSRVTRLGVGGGLGTVVLALLYYFLGGDPTELLQQVGDPSASQQAPDGPYEETPEEMELREFISVVLADTEQAWHSVFRDLGRRYEEPTLVLFTDAVDSGCGFAQSAVGPFYCPSNRKVYIDLGFYRDLQDRFGAPGDFAQAYVIAHEIGHHVQNLLGLSDEVHSAQQRASREDANSLSIRMELQADCLAGVWAHHAGRSREFLEAGDVEEGLRAASAIGDDRIQMQTQGYVAPESFTHGSAAQRVRWFRRGIEQGALAGCDTFGSGEL